MITDFFLENRRDPPLDMIVEDRDQSSLLMVENKNWWYFTSFLLIRVPP